MSTKIISPKQKGNITESRISELITLYGEKDLACYKPVSDDEGIDLIVKERISLNTIFIQIKSRFNPDRFVADVRKTSLTNKYSMAFIFCIFRLDDKICDIDNELWFIPAPDFIENIKNAREVKHGNNNYYRFSSGIKKKTTNNWGKYVIHKNKLSDKIINLMKKIK